MKRKINFKDIMKKVVSFVKGHMGLFIDLALALMVFILFYWKGRLSRGALIAAFIVFIYFIPSLIRLITGKKKRKWTKEEKKLAFKKGLIALLSIFIVGIFAAIAFFIFIAQKAPDFDPEALYKTESTIIYFSDGSEMAKIGTEKREKITYDEMPEVLVDAIVATEDSRFFQHNGFDLPRFTVAAIKQVLGMSDAGGASTITMQVVKNTWTSTVSSGIEGIVRKFTDIYMAVFKVEKAYTKQEILEFYVNSNYLGSGAYGVEQASLTYFNKHASELNLSEAATIAGLFNAPDYLDPYKYPARAESRRKTVLYLMKRHGYITDEEYQIALQLTVPMMLNNSGLTTSDYQGVIDTVVAQVKSDTGQNPYTTPMEIYTTIMKDEQAAINDMMNGVTYSWENDAVQAGVVVLDNQTGAIVAIGAGRNKSASQILSLNYGTQIKRQIGSTAKPLYDYGPAIEYENWSTYTPVTDEPYTYSSGASIYDWDRKYNGFTTAREALRVSRNIPAVKAFQANENSNIVKFVTSLGLSPELSNGYLFESHALGGYTGESPLTMAAAYASFGNGGYYNEPYVVSKIVYRDTGETWEHKGVKVKVMSEETAYMVYDMLIDAGQYGLHQWRNINNGAQYAAKSGTSNYSTATVKAHPNWPSNPVNDLWVNGTNAQYAISLWYGYDVAYDEYVNTVNTNYHRALYAKIASLFWSNKVSVSKPAGVKEVQVEIGTNPAQLASENTPSDLITTELFKAGTEPTEVSPRFDTLSNVTNVETSYANGKMVISWKAIATPWYSVDSNLESLAASLFTDEGYRTSYIQSLKDYDDANIGYVGYNLYLKNEDGTLTLIAFTKDTNYSYTVLDTSKPLTFIIKSCYSILKSAEATGSSVTYTFSTNDNPDTTNLTFTLNGDKNITLTVGDAYVEVTPAITILNNKVDVSSQASIVTSIKDKDNTLVTSISTTKANTYTITYKVTCYGVTKSFERTVVVKEKEG